MLNFDFFSSILNRTKKKRETGNIQVPDHPGYSGKLNFSDQVSAFYGNHRSGWSFAVNCLKDLHNPNGVFFDAFIERSFYWHPENIITPHLTPWIGVIHNPPKFPPWFQFEQSNEEIFKTDVWKQSYPFCKGLFTMTEYHKKHLEKKLDVPIVSLLHPTEFPELCWNWDRFLNNKEKKIVQVGWFLRKLYSIYLLPSEGYTKIFLRKDEADMDELMKLEYSNMENPGLLTEERLNSASVVSFLPNNEYDILLSENIVFVDLHDASANNAVVECIARNTPILVNKIEPVMEYLGPDYPFYFSTLEEAAMKVMDMDLVKKTHDYLVNHPFKYKFNGEYFRDSLINSMIYKRI